MAMAAIDKAKADARPGSRVAAGAPPGLTRPVMKRPPSEEACTNSAENRPAVAACAEHNYAIPERYPVMEGSRAARGKDALQGGSPAQIRCSRSRIKITTRSTPSRPLGPYPRR